MAHRYYSITLVPREVTEDGTKVGYGTPKVDLLEIPVQTANRTVCIPETNYGNTMFAAEESLAIHFHELRVEQLGVLLEKYKVAIDKLLDTGDKAHLEGSHAICELTRELLQLTCPTPDESAAPLTPSSPTGDAVPVEKRINAVQTWAPNDMGGVSPSGWRQEDGSEIPENASLVEVIDTVTLGTNDFPVKSIFKLN